jgi:putative membrane protein
MFMWPGFIIVFFGAYLLIRETNRRHKPVTESTEESPLEILKKEYAGGKIDRNEFLEKKKDLIS